MLKSRVFPAVLGAGFVLAAMAAQSAMAETIFNTIPSPLPASLVSQPFQAQQTSEFGDYVQFAPGTSRDLNSFTVTMVNWAYESPYQTVGTSAGFVVPITLKLYNPATGGANPAVGSVISTTTLNALIPWRPEPSGGCLGTAWLSGDGCRNGMASNVTFDLSGVTAPDALIYGISYNTQSYGANPLGVDGPYNSLNVGLVTVGPDVGTDLDPDAVYWNTATQGWLTTGVAGTFGADTAWAPYTPAVQFDAPEPATMALFGVGLAGLAAIRRRRR